MQKTIGMRIREARKARGVSPDQLAAALEPLLGVRWSRPSVSNAEAGGRAFAAQEMIALAVVLGKPIAFFYAPKNSSLLVGDVKLSRSALARAGISSGEGTLSDFSTWAASVMEECSFAAEALDMARSAISRVSREAGSRGTGSRSTSKPPGST